MRALVRHHGAVPDELPARVHGHCGERGEPGHRGGRGGQRGLGQAHDSDGKVPVQPCLSPITGAVWGREAGRKIRMRSCLQAHRHDYGQWQARRSWLIASATSAGSVSRARWWLASRMTGQPSPAARAASSSYASLSRRYAQGASGQRGAGGCASVNMASGRDRKSTRLNSSHVEISYAVFCLKKKKANVTILLMSKKQK